MTSKTILVLAIAAAFVAGTITTGTLVFAAEDSFKDRCENKLDKNNFKGHVCRVLFDLQYQIDTIELTPGPQGPQGEQGIPGEDADLDPTNEIQTFVTQTKNGIQVEVLPGSRTSANLPRCSIPGQIAFLPTIAFNGDNTNPDSIPETIIEAIRISDALDSYQIDFVNPGTVRELVSITPHCLKLSD